MSAKVAAADDAVSTAPAAKGEQQQAHVECGTCRTAINNGQYVCYLGPREDCSEILCIDCWEAVKGDEETSCDTCHKPMDHDEAFCCVGMDCDDTERFCAECAERHGILGCSRCCDYMCAECWTAERAGYDLATATCGDCATEQP